MISLPNSVQIPIIVFDELLPLIKTPAELKVVLLAFRYYPQDLTVQLLQDHITGLHSTALKGGFESAVTHKILIKDKKNYRLNFDANLNEVAELLTPVKKQRKKSQELHPRLMDAIYIASNKTCNMDAEAKWAKLLVQRIQEGTFIEQDVFDCLEWAMKHEFSWFTPSLISVGKLMPKYVVHKNNGTLDTYKETKQEAQGRRLEEAEQNKDDLIERAINEKY